MSDMIKVRLVQQMSGARADGRSWPPVGGEFEVTQEEAEWLFHTSDGNPHPIAIPVAEARKADREAEKRPAPEDPAVEIRASHPGVEPEEKPAEPENRNTGTEAETGDPPWDEPAADAPPPKRGPGRPRKDSLPK